MFFSPPWFYPKADALFLEFHSANLWMRSGLVVTILSEKAPITCPKPPRSRVEKIFNFESAKRQRSSLPFPAGWSELENSFSVLVLRKKF
jgi:hypothetical protein